MYYWIKDKIIKHHDKLCFKNYKGDEYVGLKNSSDFCKIIKRSDDILDLIEVGDLVKRIYKGEIEILDVNKIYLDNLKHPDFVFLKNQIQAIYKSNSKGDYIKVWECKKE